LTDEWGCVNSDQVTIEVREKPVANAGPDQILNFLFATEMNASYLKVYESGEWALLKGTGVFSDKYSNITSVSELSVGENIFVWIVSNGVCSVSADTVMIMVNDLILPTLITPNMDGRNDYFVIKGIETLGLTGLNVFNRWGAIVFSSDIYKNDWDGNDQSGNQLPDDTYFYIIKPEKLNPIKGYIVIRR
jgi:gliding motility-associated-like protein